MLEGRTLTVGMPTGRRPFVAGHLVRVIDGHPIGQRQSDGYINATALSVQRWSFAGS